jgi:hypothetical protein
MAGYRRAQATDAGIVELLDALCASLEAQAASLLMAGRA